MVAILTIAAACCLGYWGASLGLWTLFAAAVLAVYTAPVGLWAVFAAIAAMFNVRPIRRRLLSVPILLVMRKFKLVPQISETERTALQAGDVWIEGELFSGKPDFARIAQEPAAIPLTQAEQKFLDGPVEELCKILHDWDIWKARDLPAEAWKLIKRERFFGMVIPEQYGGLGFSARAHSEVLCKLASRSGAACVTVMVPNSLGPAELLVQYGTEEQKQHYLPRLATGEEIPCFALTEPDAGSDAASIQSSGNVFKGSDGKLYLKLNWNKRWITLAAISTVLGLAFRLRDPDHLLGPTTDLGITCALIPSRTPGVTVNRRHDPMGVPFYNSPTQGKDVVVPIDAIIGGPAWAGRGWQMLMESLAAGRGISLPALTTGGAKLAARVASAHSVVRKQFGVSIGKFDGVVEALARIGGTVYLMDAARKFTLAGIDQGRHPPIVTAIAKYHFTELGRQVINDAMDILGGQGISRGPSNLLSNGYIATPIAITVEGANILTRTLMIFGQGALRAHPYAFSELEAIQTGDAKKFDTAFWSHIGHVIRNGFRFVLLSLSRGRFSRAPENSNNFSRKYWRKLAWASAAFAFVSDLTMAMFGGSLKFKERITGRFADILSWMYLGTATLRRFDMEREYKDLPYFTWAMDTCFNEMTTAFEGILANFHSPVIDSILGRLIRGPVLWLTRLNPITRVGASPSDQTGSEVAALMQHPGVQRDRIFGDIYIPHAPDVMDSEPEPLYRLENAFKLTIESESVAADVRKAIRRRLIQKNPLPQATREAFEKGFITEAEYNSFEKAEVARAQAIRVDDFGLAEYLGVREVGTHSPPTRQKPFKPEVAA